MNVKRWNKNTIKTQSFFQLCHTSIIYFPSSAAKYLISHLRERIVAGEEFLWQLHIHTKLRHQEDVCGEMHLFIYLLYNAWSILRPWKFKALIKSDPLYTWWTPVFWSARWTLIERSCLIKISALPGLTERIFHNAESREKRFYLLSISVRL